MLAQKVLHENQPN